MNECRFEKWINLRDINSTSSISFWGSRFNGELFMDGIDIEENLLMSGGAEFGNVYLLSAKIRGKVIMIGSKFKGKLVMDSVDVKKYLSMRGGAEYSEVDLRNAKIGGQLDMRGSKFYGKLGMENIDVKQSLLMDEGAEFIDVDLSGAKIGGLLNMGGSRIYGQVDMESLVVRRDLLMYGSTITLLTPIDLSFARIGGSLVLSESNLNSINLTGAQIGKEFHLASENQLAPIWNQESKLTLRNTEVSSLVDFPEAWPDELELDGFTYARLGGLGGDSKRDMDSRDLSWLIGWIEKDKSYSPQPYEQLASILEKEGQHGKARDILFHGKQQEQSEAHGLDKLWLFLNGIFIGYGYRVYYAAFWAFGFIIFGMILLNVNKSVTEKREKGNFRSRLFYFFNIFFYSLDMFLPIIKLDDRHKVTTLPEGVRYYFYIHHMMGYVLGFFLIAGLSGLVTK
jgi:uncharacterized protein YjbI with pentapeptide repeats